MKEILLFKYLALLPLWWFAAATFAANEASNNTYNRVHLSISANESVENDTLIAVLYSQREGTKLADLADAVNQQIADAVKQSKQIPNIDVQTLSYQTYPIYNKQQLSGWRVRQSISLKSQDSERLSQLLGDLQRSLAMESIDYQISPEKMRAVEDELITEAVAAFNQRAKLVTSQFGYKDYRLVDININTAGTFANAIRRRGAAMAMESSIAAPTIEAGKQTVEITVSGAIEMQFE